MIEMIEQDVLPLLRRIEAIDDFIPYADNPWFVGRIGGFPIASAIIHAARGDVEAALAACDEVKRQGHIKQLRPDDYARVIGGLEPLLQAGDRAGVARLLHEWEAISVRNLRLEKYWEPSPYPIEQ